MARTPPRRRSALFRIIAAVTAFACLGAAATILVAWSCALRAQVDNGNDGTGVFVAGKLCVTQGSPPVDAIDLRGLEPPPSDRRDPLYLTWRNYQGFGITDRLMIADGPDPLPEPPGSRLLVNRAAPSIHNRSWHAGWPVPALYAVQHEWQWDQPAPWGGPWKDAYPLEHLARTTYLTSGTGLSRPPLPLRIDPRGFAIDTSFYAAALAAPFLFTRVISWLRHRPDACESCGYALAGLPSDAACPECGSTRA